MLDYILNERGPLTVLGVEGLAFVNTKHNTDPDWPDIQFHFAPSSINSDGGENIKRILNLRDKVYNTVYKPLVKYLLFIRVSIQVIIVFIIFRIYQIQQI